MLINKLFFPICLIMLMLMAVPATLACSTHHTDNSFNSIPAHNADSESEDKIYVKENGLMVESSIDDLIIHSDAIIIGRVSEILAPRWCEGLIEGQKTICTDSIIVVTRYLYGQTKADYIAVKVLGGQIENTTVSANDMPSFYKGEEVLLLLERPLQQYSPPANIDPENYYWVTGLVQGKYSLNDSILTDWEKNTMPLSEMEQRIEKINK
jgi:hypothetical protein